MRHFFLILFLTAGIGSAFAQKNSVVGKWQITAISMEGLEIDFENPSKGKKLLAAEMKKESGSYPDSATLEITYNAMTAVFRNTSLEFTQDGQAIYTGPSEDGTIKKEVAKYTVDYTAGTLTTVETKNGKEEKDVMKIKFEGGYLWLDNAAKGESFKVTRAK